MRYEELERTQAALQNKICVMFADITLVAILLADPLFPLTSELGFQFSVHVLKTNVLS